MRKKKRGIGRPPIPESQKRVILSTRIDPKTLAQLEHLAESQQCRFGVVIDRLVSATIPANV